MQLHNCLAGIYLNTQETDTNVRNLSQQTYILGHMCSSLYPYQVNELIMTFFMQSDKKFGNEPHVMTYRHITTKNYMTYDIKFSHIVAALITILRWKEMRIFRQGARNAQQHLPPFVLPPLKLVYIVWGVSDALPNLLTVNFCLL